MLNKINKDSVQDMVFAQLKKAILDGTFQPGDRLPSENELCAQLGVSRPSVKLAIQRLCTLGMAETRRGDGTFIIPFNPSVLFGQVTDFMVNESNIHEVAEYRMYTEIMCAQLAAKRATEEDFAKMYSILDQMDASLEAEDFEEHSRLDFLLHMTIAKATKNDFLIKMYTMMDSINMQYILLENRAFFSEYKKTEFSDVHRPIVDAIRENDMQRCMAIYHEKYTL